MVEALFNFNFLDVFRELVIHLVDRDRLILEPRLCVPILVLTLAELQAVIVSPTIELSIHEADGGSMIEAYRDLLHSPHVV